MCVCVVFTLSSSVHCVLCVFRISVCACQDVWTEEFTIPNLKMRYKFIESNSGRDAVDNSNNDINQFGDEYASIKISFSLHNKLPHINYNSYSKVHATPDCMRISGSSIDG